MVRGFGLLASSDRTLGIALYTGDLLDIEIDKPQVRGHNIL